MRAMRRRSQVSTRSRLKAAGGAPEDGRRGGRVSTRSRLKAAGGASRRIGVCLAVSTRSRLKAAAANNAPLMAMAEFQHAAA